MPDPKEPVKTKGKSDFSAFTPTKTDIFYEGPSGFQTMLPTITPDGKGSKYDVFGQYTDPFSTAGAETGNRRYDKIEDRFDNVQPWYDKLGNGTVKFAGAFADGVLSTLGTVYGIPASIISGTMNLVNGTDDPSFSQLWDNPLSNMGHDIQESISEGFKNYQSLDEKEANPWSPTYWATTNFLADGIIANLGYAAAAYATGSGVSKLLSKLAPYIAGRNLKTGLDIIKSDGIDALKAMDKAYSAVRRWDHIQQATSIGIAAAGEASTEALSASKETKRELMQHAIDRYGGEEHIPDSVLQQIEQMSRSAGNSVYGVNVMLLAGVNALQFGKSLSGFNSEFKAASRNKFGVKAGAQFGEYELAETAVKKGVGNWLYRNVPKVFKGVRSNLAEAGQEGLQFLTSEGQKNWYVRKFDGEAWEGVMGFLDPYIDAAEKLVTTQEGVANILGGFAGGSAFGMRDYIKQFMPSRQREANLKTLEAINNPFASGNIKTNIKEYLESAARHASLQTELDQALNEGDERKARNLKFDQLKTYINSRIQTGRMDLLGDEINQIKKMDETSFRQFFNIDPSLEVNKDAILDTFQNTAKEMNKTWQMIDRLYNPGMYKIQDLPEAEQKKKLEDLDNYKRILWSYMMDYKNRDERSKSLDNEISQSFGGVANIGTMLQDKFKSDELNDLYRQYVSVSVEHELNKKYIAETTGTEKSPTMSSYTELQELKELQARLKKKINEFAGGNVSKFVSFEELREIGDKDAIDQYLFNLDKQIIPVLNNPVVQAGLDISNYKQIMTKVHDMAELLTERKLAINAYNQISGAVKSGRFLSRLVENPNYDKEKHEKQEQFIKSKDKDPQTGEDVYLPNPDYVPEFITNEEYMEYDGYAKKKDERRQYYQELKNKKDQDQKEKLDFLTELEEATKDSELDEHKDFHARVLEHVNGSERAGMGFKNMTNDQLSRVLVSLDREQEAAVAKFQFSTDTKEERDNFDREGYIDLMARFTAANNEASRRRKVYEVEILRRANLLVTDFYAKKWTMKDLEAATHTNGAPVEKAVIDKAKEIIAQKEAAKEQARKAQEARKSSENGLSAEDNTIVSDEAFEDFHKTGKVDPKYAVDIVVDLANKIASGEELNDREFEFYEALKAKVDAKLKKKGIDAVAKRKPTSKLTESEPNPLVSDVPASGIANANKQINIAAEETVVKPTGEAFIKIRRSDLEVEKDASGKTIGNKYDEKGKPVIKNLTNFNLFDAASDQNFTTVPFIRAKFTGAHHTTGKKEPIIYIEVSEDGRTYSETGYYLQGVYDLDGKELTPAGITENQKKAYLDLLKGIQEDAVKNGHVDLELRSAVSFGKLIPTPITNGERERWGLKKAFDPQGTIPFNDFRNRSSVHFGVITNDSQNDAVIAYIDENRAEGSQLTSINDKPGIHVPQTLLNAVTRIKEDRVQMGGAGQHVALLPTGHLQGKKQIYFPVLLSNARLAKHQTNAYNIGSGGNRTASSTIGEVVVDALLNPFDSKYSGLFGRMFEMVGLNASDFKGDETDWNKFYTDDNIHRLLNKIFFASGQALNKGEYVLPFQFQVNENKDPDNKAISIKIGIGDASLAKQKQIGQVFITTKDGKLVKPQTENERSDFVQSRLTNYYVHKKEEPSLSYEDIQNTIKGKVYRVNITDLSASKPKPYTGFILDGEQVTAKTFNSYFDYIDEMGLLETTVQGVPAPFKDHQQFFINQEIYLKRKTEVKPATQPKVVTPKKEKVIEAEKGKLGGDTGGFNFQQKPTAEAQAAAQNMGGEAAGKTSKTKTSSFRSANSLGKGLLNKNKGKALIDLSIYKTIRQRNLNVSNTAEILEQEDLTSELTAMLLDDMLREFKYSKKPLSVSKLKSKLLHNLHERMFDYVQSVRPGLKEFTLNQWKNLEEGHPDYGYLMDDEIENLSFEDGRIYDALIHAVTYFDIKTFQQKYEAGEIDQDTVDYLTVGQDQNGQPLFFIGYANKAISRLAELNIINTQNNIRENVELNLETGDYKKSFEDDWALRINPKSTLAIQAKIILNTIPDVELTMGTDRHGNPVLTFQRVSSSIGFTKFLPYDTVFTQVAELGMKVKPGQFEHELMIAPAHSNNPVITALRMKLQEVKQREGTPRYKQMVQQLATASQLKRNSVVTITLEKNKKYNGRVRIFSGAKQNINNQIIDTWQGQFTAITTQNNLIVSEKEIDQDNNAKNTNLDITRYRLNYDFHIELKKDIDAIMNKEGQLFFNDYLSIVHAVKKHLGIEFLTNDYTLDSESGETIYGVAAANVLQFIASKGENQKLNLFTYVKKGQVQSFSDLIKRVLVNNIAFEIKQSVVDGRYNPEEPFSNSVAAFDTFARIFRSQHKNVFNSQAKNVNGDNEYTLIPGDMLNDQVKELTDEDHLRQLRELPIGEHNFFLNQMFVDTGFDVEFTPTAIPAWMEMKSDLISGTSLTEHKYNTVQQAKKAAEGDVDILSMTLFQNTENVTIKDDKVKRGKAFYFVPFGDSSTASHVEFSKEVFDFDYTNGHLTLKKGRARNIVYSLFKSEVNRIRAAFDQFNKVIEQEGTIEEKKKLLDKDYHYFEKDGQLIPGAATHLYYFGEERYSAFMVPGNPLYEVMAIGNTEQYRAIGLKEGLINDDNTFNDEELVKVFDSFIDDHLTNLVNSKIKLIEPYKGTLINIVKHNKNDNGTFSSPQFTMPVFDNQAVKSTMTLFGKAGTFEGVPMQSYNDVNREYQNEKDAEDNGFPDKLLKAMVIDQQINHFIFLTNFKQLSDDFAQYNLKGTYKGFIDNNIKRDKKFVTPFNKTASDSSVQTLVYEDVTFGQAKVERSKIESTLKPMEREVLDFLGMTEGLVSARYESLAAIYYANRHINKLSVAQVENILRQTLKSQITDGGTLITLREYLFQMMEEGGITSSDFTTLYNKYQNPDLKDEDFDLNELKLKGQKMVAAGAMITGDRKATVYMKDGKMVLIPAQVKGTKLGAILHDMMDMEGRHSEPSPGIQLAPVSAMKAHNAKVVKLFDDNGNVVPHSEVRPDGKPGTVLRGAELYSFPRSIYGTQVQNPDKNTISITLGSQLQKYMWNNVPHNQVFAEDMFELATEGFDEFFGTASDKKDILFKGATTMELMSNMVNIQREMRERQLLKYIEENGLEYNISNAYKQAFETLKLENTDIRTMEDFETYIERLSVSRNKAERDEARELEYIKFDLIVRSIDLMIHDIKNQAVERKGMDISQLRVFDDILINGVGPEAIQQLKMPLTFTPGNKQYQSVVLAKIEKLFAHTKVHGFSGMQISSVGHEAADDTGLKSAVEGSTALKGYGLKYDGDGKVIGFESAEIAVPWIFKDAKGKLLNYSDYVNEDGTPKKGKFTEEMLKLVSYRIPNTGTNMAGRFTIAKFFKPGYRDAIMIPDELYSQMGTDLDFDKLYNYLYNYTIQPNGVITKVEGVINRRQKNSDSVLKTEQAKKVAFHNSLLMSDKSYRQHYNLLKTAYGKFYEEFQSLITPEEQDDNTVGLGQSELGEQLNIIREKIKAEEIEETDSDLARARKDLKEKFTDLERKHNEFKERHKRKQEAFNIDGFLNARTNNYLKAQTDQQLENAYIGIYHILLSDLNMLGGMLSPLTTDAIHEEVNSPRVEGKSYAELQQSSVTQAPNSEVFQLANRAKIISGDSMVGAMANTLTTTFNTQTANLFVGSRARMKRNEDTGAFEFVRDENDKIQYHEVPVVAFLDNDNNIIQENDKDESRFVTKEPGAGKYGEERRAMSLNIKGETFKVPYRLDRMRDVTGKKIPVSFLQSVLQGYLDLQKDTSVVYTNINIATINATVAMNLLGYVDHIVPFMQQQIIKDFARIKASGKSPFINSFGLLYDTVYSYAKKAGIPDDIIDAAELAEPTSPSAFVSTLISMMKRGEGRFDGYKYFSIAQLDGLTQKQYSSNLADRDTAYYTDQLFVMDMFFRLDKVGTQLFELQQRTNLDSKGLKNSTLTGARYQIDDYNDVSYPKTHPNLVGAERLGKYNKHTNRSPVPNPYEVANQTLRKAFNWLPTEHNIFMDFAPMFTTLRDTLYGAMKNPLGLKDRKPTIDEVERFNINIVQFTLSNPQLFEEFLSDFTEDEKKSAYAIRKRVFTNKGKYVRRPGSENKKTYIEDYILEDASLALLISKVAEQTDPNVLNAQDEPLRYKSIYPVLDFFKLKIAPGGETNWVSNYNTNQFRERMGQEMPQNIYRMMEDENPDIQKIARFFFLYYYMSGGVTTPASFGHMLPQELLFKKDGFSDKIADFLNSQNSSFRSVQQEVEQNATGLYYKNKPKWFAYIDPAIVKVNRDASEMIHRFITQFAQNHPFDNKTRMNDEQFEQVEDRPGLYTLTKKGMEIKGGERSFLPPWFTDEQFNVYVINKDYETYSRYNRAGTGNLFVEYDALNHSVESIIEKNGIRDKQTEIEVERFEVGGNMDDGFIFRDIIKTPVTEDKQSAFLPLLNAVLEEATTDRTTLSDIENREIVELKELGKVLMEFVPGNTQIMPMSLENAAKTYPSFGGALSYNGRSASGIFKNGDPSYIEVAHGYLMAKKNPLDELTKVLLHEGAHAATYNVLRIMKKYANKELKAKEVVELLGIKVSKDTTNTQLVKEMLGSYNKLVDIFDSLKTNTRFREYYAEASSMNKNNSNTQLDQFILNDMDEFIAQLFNNKALREALNKLPYQSKKQGMFGRIMELLAQLLGLNKDGHLYHTFGNLFDLLEPLKGSDYIENGMSTKQLNTIYGGAKKEDSSKPLLVEANPTGAKPFTLRRFDRYAFEMVEKNGYGMSMRAEKLETGIYEFDGKNYEVSLRGLKKVSDLKESVDQVRALTVDGNTHMLAHIQEFYNDKTPLYVYDIKPATVDFGSAPFISSFRGQMKVNTDPNAALITGNAVFAKYVTAVEEYIQRLQDKRKKSRNNLKEVQELTDRIETQEDILDQLRSNKTIRSLVEIGVAHLDEITRYSLKNNADIFELSEGLRVANAWSTITDVIDLIREGKTEKELEVVDAAREVQGEAAAIASSISNRMKEKIVIEAEAENIKLSSLRDKDGNFRIKDKDLISVGTTSVGFSGNAFEQMVDNITKKKTFESNEDWYKFLQSSDAKMKELFGNTTADTDFVLEEYETEMLDENDVPQKVKMRGIVTMYDRAFYEKYQSLRGKAIRKEIKWKDYYKFEREHFTYSLTEEGKQAFEDYIEMMKSEFIVDEDAKGDPVYDEEGLQALRDEYDPEVFLKYLASTETDAKANKGARWLTKEPKDIPLNKNYTKLNDAQKKFYQWFTEAYMDAYENSVFDYRVGQTDIDQLIMSFSASMTPAFSERMKHAGAAAVDWLKDIYSVKVGRTKVDTITRPLTGKEHIGVQFQGINSFINENGKINPLDILRKFKAASISFKHKRDVEETLNVINDLVHTSLKQETNNSGLAKTKLSGVLHTTTDQTNIAKRVDYTIKSYLQGFANDQSRTLFNTPEGKRGFSLEQVADNINKFTRFRYMALSPLSATGNFIMGCINNFIYAASGEFFTDMELARAVAKLKTAPFKYFSHGKVASKEARIVAEIMYRYNIVGDVTEQLNYGGDALSWFFTLQKSGEYMVQGATALAQMMHQKIKLKDGTETDLLKLYNLDENKRLVFDYDKLPEDSEWRKPERAGLFFERVVKVNQKIHGDYQNPLLVKKTVYGRAAMLFRTWLPMSIKERFGAQYEDRILGTQKGRYRSVGTLLASVVKRDKGTDKLKVDLKQVGEIVKLFLKLVPGINKMIKFGDTISERDKNNLTMFAREMQMIIMLLMATASLKALVKNNDDEDDDSANFLVYLHNQGERMQSELQLFFSPKDYNQILRDLIPMTKTIKDAESLIYATIDYIGDPESDTYTRGFRKGQSKVSTKFQQFLPVSRSAQSTWAAWSQIYTDDRFK